MATIRTLEQHLSTDYQTRLARVVQDSDLSEAEVLADWIMNPLPRLEELDFDSWLERIPTYNKIQLWTLVHRQWTALQADQYKQIMNQQRTNSLDSQQQQLLDALLDISDKHMLLRAKALNELQERGILIEEKLSDKLK